MSGSSIWVSGTSSGKVLDPLILFTIYLLSITIIMPYLYQCIGKKI